MARLIFASIALSLIFVIESSALNYKFGSRRDGKRNEILNFKKRNIFPFKSLKILGDRLIRMDSPLNKFIGFPINYYRNYTFTAEDDTLISYVELKVDQVKWKQKYFISLN